MKKYLFTLLVCLSVFSFSSVKAVEKGDFVIQPSLNLGNFNIVGDSYSSGRGIGVTANFDYAVHNYISVGGFVGFNNVSNRNSNYSYNRIGFGARGIFHFWQLIDDKAAKDLKSDKVDFYLPVHVGYGIYSGNGLNGGDVVAGLGIGIRYYFNEKFGIAFETGGMELSYAKLGVAIKL
jgi:hypothetical protein